MIRRDPFYFRLFCIIFWMVGVSSFVIEEILPFLDSLKQVIMLVSDVIILILGLVTLKTKKDKILIVAFAVLGVLSSVVNKVPAVLWVNGFRDYIPFLMLLPLIRYFMTCDESARFRESFDRQLKYFLILQAFCVTEQFILYGANDAGGGSLGFGYSGTISMVIILLSFYFVSKNWDGDNYLRSLWENRLYVFLMFPVFLNETKVSFLLLLVYFLLLYPFKIQSIGKMLIALPVVLIVAAGLAWAYMWATNMDELYDLGDYLSGGTDPEEVIELAEMAIELTESEDFDAFELDIPRFLKLTMMPGALERTRGGLVLGAGLGHMKGWTTLERTPFARENGALLFGTRMSAHMFFLSLGILGMIWVCFWYWDALDFKKKEANLALQTKLFLLMVAVLGFFYSDSFRYIVPCIVFYYLSMTSSYALKQDKKRRKR